MCLLCLHPTKQEPQRTNTIWKGKRWQNSVTRYGVKLLQDGVQVRLRPEGSRLHSQSHPRSAWNRVSMVVPVPEHKGTLSPFAELYGRRTPLWPRKRSGEAESARWRRGRRLGPLDGVSGRYEVRWGDALGGLGGPWVTGPRTVTITSGCHLSFLTSGAFRDIYSARPVVCRKVARKGLILSRILS